MFVGDTDILHLFLADMGIREAYIGNERIYLREGGYFYLELEEN